MSQEQLKTSQADNAPCLTIVKTKQPKRRATTMTPIKSQAFGDMFLPIVEQEGPDTEDDLICEICDRSMGWWGDEEAPFSLEKSKQAFSKLPANVKMEHLYSRYKNLMEIIKNIADYAADYPQDAHCYINLVRIVLIDELEALE